MRLVHFTLAYLDNTAMMLNVEGYVPKEAIIDTGAAKAMCSVKFAAAIGVDMRKLNRVEAFVTASGAVERPLGLTGRKLKFNLGRGTDNPCVVEMEVTVVDTTAYDVLLGMEFIRAVKGSYCSYTEKFTYRCMDEGGHLRSSTINAPCHAITRPLVAYAYFAGLIRSEEDPQDAQCGFEDTIPVDDDFGFHTSPLQVAATSLKDLVEVCDRETEVRASKEVRSNDLLRRENAAVRLSSVAPLSLPPLLPSSQ